MMDVLPLQKIRQLQIRTRRLISGTQAGAYITKRSGIGLEFNQLREYYPGDDIRFIDWNATARSRSLLIREHREERNRTIIIAVDVSGSMFYGSHSSLKIQVASEIAASLAFAGSYNQDCVGILLFSDEVETYIPPSRGDRHVHRVMRVLQNQQKSKHKTSIQRALREMVKRHRSNVLCVIISDFLDTNYESLLRFASSRHEMLAVHVEDRQEVKPSLPDGLELIDAEEKDVSDQSDHIHGIADWVAQRKKTAAKMFQKCGVARLLCRTDEDYVRAFIHFLRRR
jgi:uncharacterized protein (DUF58 family)